MPVFKRVLLAIALAAFAGSSWAVAPLWEQLTPAQQSVLAPLQAQFDGLPEPRRDQLAVNALRISQLPPARRELAQQRLQQWQQLSEAQRQQALTQREQFRRLPPADRIKARQRFEQLRGLAPAERRRMRERFDQLKQQPGGLDAACPGTTAQKLECLSRPADGSAAAATP
jgi:hypothetical protein